MQGLGKWRQEDHRKFPVILGYNQVEASLAYLRLCLNKQRLCNGSIDIATKNPLKLIWLFLLHGN